MRTARWVAVTLMWLAAPLAAAEYPYDLRYDVRLVPEKGHAHVAITLSKGARHVRWMRFHVVPGRHRDFSADGDIERDGEYVTWTPPDKGGALRFKTPIDHKRGDRFDARMTDEWAVFRGDDLVPPATVRMRKGAEARATLHVQLPDGWSFATAYPKADGGGYVIEHPQRSFDRPTGWMAAGELGVRWGRVDGVSTFIAGPVSQGVRRLDIMAFLRWNLPRVRNLVPDMGDRLLVVSARDGMWRGGLSGPHSLYVHADRPLISENGTSSLLHELMHVALRLDAVKGADWIVEGLAEYYSLELMRRSGTISERRFEEALEELEEWGDHVDLTKDPADGETTARAVLVLHALDREIRRTTGDAHNLDDVVRRLIDPRGNLSLKRLRSAVREIMGKDPKTLAADALPGIDDDD